MSEQKLNKEDTLAKTVFGRFIQQKLRGSDNEEWRHREVKDVIEEMKDATLLRDLMEVPCNSLHKASLENKYPPPPHPPSLFR